MSHTVPIEARVSILGQLFGYRLEGQPISPRLSRRSAQPPDTTPWMSIGTRFQPDTPMRIRANGGLFGPTTEIEIYPLGKKVRTPDDTRHTHIPLPAYVRTYGILTVSRG
jgi:hypothetical protein